MTPQEINAVIAWANVRQKGMHDDGLPAILLLASEYDKLIATIDTLIQMGKQTSEALDLARLFHGFEPDEEDDY